MWLIAISHMKIINISAQTPTKERADSDPIYVFLQFFVTPDTLRNDEIRSCLKRNVGNPYITHIYLLNERLFTPEEMDLPTASGNKITQSITGRRLTYECVFRLVRQEGLKGYIIIINADIFFDVSLNNLHTTLLSEQRQFLTQLRHEANLQDLTKSPIFGPRFESQDAWIYHTSQAIPPHAERVFDFELGKPGCDNKFIYLLNLLGYTPINDPCFVKIYHLHQKMTREYTIKDTVQAPWGIVTPFGYGLTALPISLDINLQRDSQVTHGFRDMMFNDNDLIYGYIRTRLTKGQNFIIPRVSGIENNIAVFGRLARSNGGFAPDVSGYVRSVIPIMKRNAGIKMTSIDSLLRYSDMYLNAFDDCEIYGGWEPWGHYIHHIQQSYDILQQMYPHPTKRAFWSFAFDIFHYIYTRPWTHALRGKTILVISPFVESLKEQITRLRLIYDGVDLFPECQFKFIRPPQTHAEEPSMEFDQELSQFMAQLNNVGHYDVALVSAGGYGNPICSQIYRQGKSAIYVGGVLQMYFGILGQRWVTERPDVVKLFKNQYWIRPKDSEKPRGFKSIEGGCYW